MDEGPAREDAAAVNVADALAAVENFAPGADGLARKSRELTLDLLRYSAAPFHRDQFTPGHLTCTALVLHPRDSSKVLLMHHHRLHRWLLPGGHVEDYDRSLADAAAREANEETHVRIDPSRAAFLAGIDVHGIPAKKKQPYHLHHDLIWCFHALTEVIETTDEAPSVLWAESADLERLNVAESIRNSIWRSRARG
jgi:8-oxo-dGTP pyrophosphatase MutT (NUDIX family)